MEIPRVILDAAGLQAPTGVAGAQGFDLDDFGAEPGQGFGTGGPGLELREVHNANVLETLEVDVHAHCPSLPLQSILDALASPCRAYHRRARRAPPGHAVAIAGPMRSPMTAGRHVDPLEEGPLRGRPL